MRVSLSWLNELVPIDEKPNKLANALTMAGLEVESVFDRYQFLESVLVGRIVSVKNHPNADRLEVCEVDVKKDILQVVCGAPNVKEGMLSPLALPGTQFPNDFILEKGVIRGVSSEGMLCSEAELTIGDDESGIMALDSSLEVGQSLSDALRLSDTVMEIDLTPNRPDCLSIIGLAREVSAIQKKRMSIPEASLPVAGKDIHHKTSVTVEATELCPRYAARLIENVTIAPSPFWLQDRIRSVGLRPINNIVDITNFVLMEFGQPLHAFDFDRLAESRIVVRGAEEGETFTTLDEKERSLSKDMLLICDGEKPVAIAGIMGGLNSEIESSTTRVLIESAYFNPISIRKTAKKLGLFTDASHRFERGVDPRGTITALDRAALLMVSIGKGTMIEGLIDVCGPLPKTQTIRLSVKETNRLLGTNFDKARIQELLKQIEFIVESGDEDTLVVTAPSFRIDVQRPEDLMEEIARLSGYNNIPTTFPSIPADKRKPLKTIGIRQDIKSIMNGFGFHEAINYSFMNEADCDRLLLETEDHKRKLVKILNPLTEDQTVMRSSLIPGLLRSAHRNLSKQVKTNKLFEIGKVFMDKGHNLLPQETEMLAGLWTGAQMNSTWQVKETPCDFYDIKGAAEGLLSALNIGDISFTLAPKGFCKYVTYGRAAQIRRNEDFIGIVGEVHRSVLHHFDLKQTIFIFELDMSRLYGMIPEVKQAKPTPKYPAISRDVTVIIDKDIEANRLIDFIDGMHESLVEQLYIFDIFIGDPIPAGKKSISFRIVYRSQEKTLEDDIVNKVHKKLSEKLIDHFNASLPG